MLEISLIICTRNRDDMVEDVLKSASDQSLDSSKYEVLLLDQSTNDKTQKIAENYKNVHYIKLNSQGLSLSRNEGVKRSQGSILVFLDDDVRFGRNYLADILNFFKNSELKPDFIGGKTEIEFLSPKPEWIDGPLLGILAHSDYGDEPIIYDSHPKHVPYGCNMAIKREYLEKVGGFSTSVSDLDKKLTENEDVILANKLRQMGCNLVYFPKMHVYHKMPQSRLNYEYYRKRYYSQGYSDSYIYYLLNMYSRKEVPAKIWLHFTRLIGSLWGRLTNKKPSELYYQKLRLYYNAGYLRSLFKILFSKGKRTSKILFISHTLDIGGAELILKSVAEHCKKQDYNVEVWGPYEGTLGNDYKALGINCHVQDFEVDRANRDQKIDISLEARKKINNLINYCSKNNKKLTIRCAGSITKRVLNELDFSNANLVGILDNNKSLWGKEIKGYKIHPLSDFDDLRADVVLIAHTKPDFLKAEFKGKKVKVISDIFTDSPLKRFNKYISYLTELISPVEFIRKINPDIVFVNNARPFWAVVAGKILGKKVIWNIHENYEPKTFRVFPHSLYLYSFKLADRLIFPTYACYEYYRSVVPEDKVSIINGGINLKKLESLKSDRALTRKELNIPENHKVICNIGAMIELKGQTRLANAGMKMLESSKDMTFIFIGAQDNEYSESLRKMCSEYQDNFKIITNDHNPYKYLNASDIYVCSSYMESFGLVLLEAMAFKKPVIATDTGGIPEIITNNETGILVPVENLESHVIFNIQRLLANQDFANILKGNAYKQLLEKFTIDKMLDNYLNTIKTFL